jgi:predicted ATPase
MRQCRRPMAGVTINLLGGFAATVDGVPMAENGWRLRKARELVKLLALAPGHRVHREQAMEALWPERDPGAAANNLHQAVYVARRALGATAIVVREEQIRLGDGVEVDVDDFERAAAAARRDGAPAALRAAQALYAGELLPENRYDDWVAARREELAQIAHDLTDALDGLGGMSELRGLPTETSSFVGREHELTELRALLHRTRLLTLTGTGGAGKTRLALELAREAEPDFDGRCAFVELASLIHERQVADAVAATMNIRPLPGDTVANAIGGFLAGRPFLLVLDNCEHVLGAAAGLAELLLRRAPALVVVATSREALRVAGEIVFRVASLTIPDPEHDLAPEELLRYEAVRLFAERAASAAPGFAVDASTAAEVARICFRLDGLPLALELAAGRLGALGAGSIAERLDDRFSLLRAGSRFAPTRQQTLAATLEWSHDLLDSAERVLFRRLGVFAGGFELAAVETVCAGDGADAPAVADLLARLVEKSLVSAEGGGRERRYRLLETIRMYAREQLRQAGEERALNERHAAWALAFALRERGSTRCDTEAANLRAAFDTLLASGPRDALRLAVAIWPFWLRRIDLAEAERRFDAALTAVPGRTALRAEALLAAAALDLRGGALRGGVARASESLDVAAEIGDPVAEWNALLFLGNEAMTYETPDLAIRRLTAALEIARREGMLAEEALCVYAIGVARWVGDLDGADDLVAQSAELFRALAGSPRRIPSPPNFAEMPAVALPGGAGVRVALEETLLPFIEVDCDAALGYVLANRASIARERGDSARARVLLDECLARFEQLGDETGRAQMLVRSGYLDLAGGDVVAARRAFERALEMRRRLRDRRGVGLVLSGLAMASTFAGDHDDAERLVGEARDLFRRAGDRWGLVNALWRTADLAMARGRLDDAEAALRDALNVLGAAQLDRWIGHTLAGLGELALLRGDPGQAARRFAEARQRYAVKNDRRGIATAEERLRACEAAAKSSQRAPG